MNRCAFLSMDGLHKFECYDNLLIEPFNKIGWQVDVVPWKKEKINWSVYDAVIIRSCWDYQQDPNRFIEVLKKIDVSSARLANSLETVQWNIDKSYLKDLGESGISIVPTLWQKQFKKNELSSYFEAFDTDEIIIKPLVGASAEDTFWINKHESKQPFEALNSIFKDAPFLVQPFIESVIDPGEFSLFFFYGTYSHTILKTPALGDFRVQEEHGGWLKKVEPAMKLLRAAEKVMDVLSGRLLYARLDFVEKNGTFLLIEAELIEPSLYFNMDSQSPARFIEAFRKWWALAQDKNRNIR